MFTYQCEYLVEFFLACFHEDFIFKWIEIRIRIGIAKFTLPFFLEITTIYSNTFWLWVLILFFIKLKIMKKELEIIVSDDRIANKIYIIREQKIMLDRDLAELYGVKTKVFNQSVKRNISRFPEDFMFELTQEENDSLRSQFVTLKRGQHSKYHPFAFTEQGVAMLSSVLNSERAIKVNIQIIRIFTRMKKIFMDNTDLRLEIEKIKNKLNNHGKNIELVFEYLDELIDKNDTSTSSVTRKEVGYMAKR